MNVNELSRLFIDDMELAFTHENVDAIVMYMDVNEDGQISFDEFFKYWEKLVVNDKEIITDPENSIKLVRLTYAANLFKTFDASKNREIGKDEFISFYQQLYNNYSANMSQIDAALQYIDTNHDGSMSFQELMHWLNWI